MEALLLIAYELASMLVPMLVAILVYKNLSADRAPWSRGYKVSLAIFAILVCGMLSVTGVPSIYDIVRTGFEIRPDAINFIPFSDPEFDIEQYALNIALFVPLGFLLPFVWKSYENLPRTLLLGLGFSVLIELFQLFSFRATDVDDLILNALGTLMGFGVFCLLRKVSGREPLVDTQKAVLPIIIVIAALAGRFFLLNEMGAARLLYGF